MWDSGVEDGFRVNPLRFICSFIDMTEHFRTVDLLEECSILNIFKIGF